MTNGLTSALEVSHIYALYKSTFTLLYFTDSSFKRQVLYIDQQLQKQANWMTLDTLRVQRGRSLQLLNNYTQTVGHVTIQFPIGHFLLVVLWN